MLFIGVHAHFRFLQLRMKLTRPFYNEFKFCREKLLLCGYYPKTTIIEHKIVDVPYQPFYMFDDYTLKNAFQAKVCVMKPDVIYK